MTDPRESAHFRAAVGAAATSIFNVEAGARRDRRMFRDLSPLAQTPFALQADHAVSAALPHLRRMIAEEVRVEGTRQVINSRTLHSDWFAACDFIERGPDA